MRFVTSLLHIRLIRLSLLIQVLRIQEVHPTIHEAEEDSLFENCDKNAGTPATKEDYSLELFTCF